LNYELGTVRVWTAMKNSRIIHTWLFEYGNPHVSNERTHDIPYDILVHIHIDKIIVMMMMMMMMMIKLLLSIQAIITSPFAPYLSSRK
jgi:hypothetical protein